MNLREAKEKTKPGRMIEVSEIPKWEPEYQDFFHAKGFMDCYSQMEPMVEAAKGLSFGTDWNNGTHAKLHGYREKLLKALSQWEKLQK